MTTEVKGLDDPVKVVGAPLLALAVYCASYAILTFFVKMALSFVWYLMPVMTALQIVCSLGGMALARLCCNVVFKIYSQLGPFILFICAGIFLIARAFLGSGNTDPLQYQLAWPVFTVAAAFWCFIYDYPRRKPFLLFLCVGVFLIAWPLMELTKGRGDNPLLLQLAWPIFTIAAAYWRFWRGRTSLSQPTPWK